MFMHKKGAVKKEFKYYRELLGNCKKVLCTRTRKCLQIYEVIFLQILKYRVSQFLAPSSKGQIVHGIT